VPRKRHIRVSVPGTLPYRSLAIRVVAEACKLVGARPRRGTGSRSDLDLSNDFDAEMVSAFSEIFNNIVLHGYGGGRETGDIDIVLTPGPDSLSVVISDTGASFDISAVPTPPLESLPHGGLGIHIVRSFVDEVIYEPGPPNVWRLTKYVASPVATATEDEDRNTDLEVK
jgi:serine/threonine-protein kinase RsbW